MVGGPAAMGIRRSRAGPQPWLLSFDIGYSSLLKIQIIRRGCANLLQASITIVGTPLGIGVSRRLLTSWLPQFCSRKVLALPPHRPELVAILV